MDVTDYYRRPAVRSRLTEYCGGTSDDCRSPTCRYLVALHGEGEFPDREFPVPVEPSSLCGLADRNVDIFRSIWDRGRALVTLDIEYCNFDFRGEAFVNARGAFRKLEPTYAAAAALCEETGLERLTVVTGQGYHLSWYVGLLSSAGQQTAALAPCLAPVAAKYEAGDTATGEKVTGGEGDFHAGAGVVAEWMGHLIIAAASGASALPVACFGLDVGNRGPVGREAGSIDLSCYADPLDRRYVRCAFSAYQKQRALAAVIGPGIAEGTPPKACIPRDRSAGVEEVLSLRDDLGAAAARAETCCAGIPDGENGMLNLLSSYRSSQLADFHRWYLAVEPDPPEQWGEGYDRLNVDDLPPCVALPVSRPNDRLLKPVNLQNLVRVLWAKGWHPRHVGGLVRSKYERDLGWGRLWLEYDAATRADVYARVLAGLVSDGTDDLRDFNCISHQEKGYCPQPFCGHSLGNYAVLLRSMVA